MFIISAWLVSSISCGSPIVPKLTQVNAWPAMLAVLEDHQARLGWYKNVTEAHLSAKMFNFQQCPRFG
jgi:hypothetical protein